MGTCLSSKNHRKVQQEEFTFESNFEHTDPESDSQSTPKEVRVARENYSIAWHGVMDAMEAAFSQTRSAATYESDSTGKHQSHRKSSKWK